MTTGPELTAADLRIIKQFFARTNKVLLKDLPIPVVDETLPVAARIRAKAAYIPIPYKSDLVRKTDLEDDPVEHVRKGLASGRSQVLIGEPGTGKTVALGLAFAELAEEFEADPSAAVLPVFIRLLNVDAEARQAGHVHALLPEPLNRLSPEVINRLADDGRLVFLFDGLDELPSSKIGGESDAGEDWAFLFHTLDHPAILSCRESFFALWIESTELARQFDERLEMLSLDYREQIGPFVTLYADALRRPDLVPDVLAVLEGNTHLASTLSRPLMLSMTVSVLFLQLQDDEEGAGTGDLPGRLDLTGSDYLTADIYRTFIVRWLDRERKVERSSHVRLSAQQKLEIGKLIAWSIFSGSSLRGAGYGSFKLDQLLISQLGVGRVIETWLSDDERADLRAYAEELRDEVCNRSFLMAAREDKKFQYAHKSFFEFVLALHVYDSLADVLSTDQLIELLGTPFPDEVIDFLRELLHWGAAGNDHPARVAALQHNLFTGLRALPRDEDTLMSRQQAANLLPIVLDETGRRSLPRMARAEHPFIFRAIAVGQALHHDDHELLDEFVAGLDEDPVSASHHLGYNRIYYGDQALASTSFRDNGDADTASFFRNCVRHLTLPPRADGAIPYFAVRSQALASIRLMLEDPVRAPGLCAGQREDLERVREMCSVPDVGQTPTYDRERIRLLSLIDHLLGDPSAQQPG